MNRLFVIFPTAFALAFAGARWATRGEVAAEAPAEMTSAPILSALPLGSGAAEADGSFVSIIAHFDSVEKALGAGQYRQLAERMVGDPDLSNIIGEWAKADPAGLWSWLERRGREQLGNFSVENQVFGNWFRLDPEATLKALASAERRHRSSGVGGIMGLAFGSDAALGSKVLEHLDQLFELDQNLGTLYLGTLDSAKLSLLDSLPESPGKKALVKKVASKLFDSDWRAATKWAETLPAGQRAEVELEFARRGVNAGVGKEQRQWVKAWLADERNQGKRALVGERLVGAMAQEDPLGALEWAEENLGGATLGKAFGAVLRSSFKKDSATAVLLVESLPPGGVRRRAAAVMLEQLAKSDSSGAVDWAVAEEQNGGDLGFYIWSQLGSSAGFFDPQAARGMLVGEGAIERADFSRAAVGNLVRKDAQGTADWAEGVGGERGKALLDFALGAWRRVDAKAAEAWEASR